MKHLLSQLIIFTLPLVIGLAVLELLLYRIPNDYACKSQWLQHHSQNIDVLYLGDSHALFGFDPEYSLFKSFNGAHVSQDLERCLLVYKHIDPLSTLSTVVLTISYCTPFEKLEQLDEWWRISYYRYYSHSKYAIKNLFISHSGRNNLKRLSDYYIKKEPSTYCTEYGAYMMNDLKYRDKDWKKSAKDAARRHSYTDFSNLSENRKILYDLIRLRPNTRFILITTPTHVSYHSCLSDKQLEVMQEFVSEAVGDNPNVAYYNYMKESRFTDEDFLDADHLSRQGAQKLTLILDSIIGKPNQAELH